MVSRKGFDPSTILLRTGVEERACLKNFEANGGLQGRARKGSQVLMKKGDVFTTLFHNWVPERRRKKRNSTLRERTSA